MIAYQQSGFGRDIQAEPKPVVENPTNIGKNYLVYQLPEKWSGVDPHGLVSQVCFLFFTGMVVWVFNHKEKKFQWGKLVADNQN